MARREIGRRQLLVLIDVPCCDPSLQHRRIADRCGRHLYLRHRPHDEEVLRAIDDPEVPFRISRFATRTVPRSVELDLLPWKMRNVGIAPSATPRRSATLTERTTLLASCVPIGCPTFR